MDLGYDVIVTITGIVLVFLILVLLMAIITLEGKIFDAINGKKAAAKAASAAKPAAPVKQAWPTLKTCHWQVFLTLRRRLRSATRGLAPGP